MLNVTCCTSSEVASEGEVTSCGGPLAVVSSSFVGLLSAESVLREGDVDFVFVVLVGALLTVAVNGLGDGFAAGRRRILRPAAPTGAEFGRRIAAD